MFCTRCGIELQDQACYCSQCGHATGLAPASAPRTGRRLVLDVENKKIGGVCAGFAQYLEMDVTMVRIIWLVTAIFTGLGFLAYLIAWLVMPKPPRPTSPATQLAPQSN